MDKVLTVAKLIKLLKEMPKEAVVLLDGCCGCTGRAGSVRIGSSGSSNGVVIIEKVED
jgi:hypothetical protein